MGLYNIFQQNDSTVTEFDRRVLFEFTELHLVLGERDEEDSKKTFFELMLDMNKINYKKTAVEFLDNNCIASMLRFNPALASKLKKHIFHLCYTREDLAVLTSIGFNPRDLINSSIVGIRGFHTESVISAECEFWEMLWDDFNMERDDFNRILVEKCTGEPIPLADFIKCHPAIDEAFKTAFLLNPKLPLLQFAKMNLESVVGDCNSCSICHDNFKDNDKVLKLECSHIFHKHCVISFLRSNHQCPYCRTPFKLQ